jgi:hypothetical protein
MAAKTNFNYEFVANTTKSEEEGGEGVVSIG